MTSMPTLHDVAFNHLKRRQKLAERTASRLLRVWGRFDLRDLDGSWAVNAERMVAEVEAAQAAAASQTASYMRASDQIYAVRPVAPNVVPAAFSGVTLDGREVGPQMYSAVTTTKRLIGAGRPPREAFTVGASLLATLVGTMVSDMGRQADLVGGVARTRTRYIRVVQPGACSRCAVLAGASSAAKAYLRHPRCQCTAFPLETVDGKVRNWDQLRDAGLYESPERYFESLSADEQKRVFTKAGAEAIRHGADPMKVVNARRGAYGIGYSGHYNPSSVRRGHLQPVTIGVRSDGSPLQVFATTEGTTVRGDFGRREIRLSGQASVEGRYRRTTTIRLMPEQIAVMAGGDQTRWVELLTRYGYLT